MIWQKALDFEKAGVSFVLITMTAYRGSAPQDPGAKCIVTKNGLQAGTIGGGKVEAAAIDKAQELLRSDTKTTPISITWNLQKDIGMTCGGEASFLFEHFPGNSWPIALFGAGHISQALSRGLLKLNCQLTIIDHRQEWIDKLEGAKTLCLKNPKEAVSKFTEKTFFISMTQGHAHDVPILFEIYKLFPNAPYIGVIGSKQKAIVVKKDLKELGVSQEFLDRLIIPLGLPIGSNDPEEISISIMAQLLQVRDSIFFFPKPAK